MAAQSCAQCGLPVALSDQFCPHCGTNLRRDASENAASVTPQPRLVIPEIAPTGTALHPDQEAKPATDIIGSSNEADTPTPLMPLPSPAPHEKDMSGLDIIQGLPVLDDEELLDKEDFAKDSEEDPSKDSEEDPVEESDKESSGEPVKESAKDSDAESEEETDKTAPENSEEESAGEPGATAGEPSETADEVPLEDTEGETTDDARADDADDSPTDTAPSDENPPSTPRPDATVRFEFIKNENPFDIESYIPQISSEPSSKRFEDDTIIMPLVVNPSKSDAVPVFDTDATRVMPQKNAQPHTYTQGQDPTRVMPQSIPPVTPPTAQDQVFEYLYGSAEPNIIPSATAGTYPSASASTYGYGQRTQMPPLYPSSQAQNPYSNWENTPANQTMVMQAIPNPAHYGASSQPHIFEGVAPTRKRMPRVVILLIVLVLIALVVAGFYKLSPEQTSIALAQIQQMGYQLGMAILEFARHVVGTGQAS